MVTIAAAIAVTDFLVTNLVTATTTACPSSGVFSIVFRTPIDLHDVRTFVDRLKLFRIGYSWGGVTSLVALPDVTESPNAGQYGYRLLRVSIGLESTQDLIADLAGAMSAVAG